MERLRVTLTPEEYSALVRLSEGELRSPPDQLRCLLRQALGLPFPPDGDRLVGGERNGQRPDQADPRREVRHA